MGWGSQVFVSGSGGLKPHDPGLGAASHLHRFTSPGQMSLTAGNLRDFWVNFDQQDLQDVPAVAGLIQISDKALLSLALSAPHRFHRRSQENGLPIWAPVQVTGPLLVPPCRLGSTSS